MMPQISKRHALAVALTIAAGTVSFGCAANSEPTAQVEAADPGYLFERIQHARSLPALDNVLEPETLVKALPNHEFKVDTGVKTVRFSFSDAVVAGEVIKVTEGDGYIYDDGDAGRIVSFDDPEADARDMVVTMRVEDAAGTGQDIVNFRMGVLIDSNPDEMMASLRGLGEAVVVLEKIESGHHTGEYIPVLSGALIGDVSSAGEADFPALGENENEFVGTTDTVDEILAKTEESAPVETIE